MERPIIVELPKDSTFQMRINSEVKGRLEELYAECGLTLTDAVNCFFQQSLNQGGMPLMLTDNNNTMNRLLAYLSKLTELNIGADGMQEGPEEASGVGRQKESSKE